MRLLIVLAEYITELPIGFTEVTIYDSPGEEYAFQSDLRSLEKLNRHIGSSSTRTLLNVI